MGFKPAIILLESALGLGLLVAGCSSSTKTANQPAALSGTVDPSLFQALRWRSIGAMRAGRAPAVAGDPTDPQIYYFGAAGGGVWKTYDAGQHWVNVSDGYLTSSGVGAMAVAPSDPNTIYIGMGETSTHPDIQGGDGVYKSTDAGATWQHMGLEDTRHIGRIVVAPHNPNVVYVAAMGHEFGPNQERGVFRSKDGGKTWQKVLYKSDDAGAVDLAMDPTNPQVIYATLWEFVRHPWTELSGGPNSGFYKTSDGGDHWTDISRRPGLPKGVLGRMGVSISASRPSRVYAIIEAADGGIFRSDDSGVTWNLVNNNRSYRFLASSYSTLIADPTNPDVVYIPWMELFKSTDGGHTIKVVPLEHSDNHALWIDSKNDKQMIEGSDGGAIVTLNGGNSWSSQYNQPTGEYYKMTVDNQFPYNVYATQMDDGAISCPSQTSEAAIEWKDCFTVGHAESGSIAVRSDNHNIVFAGAIGSSQGGGGNLYEYDVKNHEQRMITVWPEDQYGSPVKDVKYRFYFTFPVFLSPHDPNTLYVAAQEVFESHDMGGSWKAISPDLTKDDTGKMQVIDGGPITSQQFSSQYSSTLYSLAESPMKKGELWAGSDQSTIHYSPDDGKSWKDISPSDLPPWTGIYTIEPSKYDAGTAYIACNRHEMNDHTPCAEKTTDYGKTWQHIDRGIKPGDYVWVVREDPERRGLLYAGTENGVYVSFDDGANWQSLQLNLPVVAVRDLAVKDNELIAATHGRSFWILDDLTPLREATPTVLASPVHLFTIPTTYRLLSAVGFGGGQGMQFGPDLLRITGDGPALQTKRNPGGTITSQFINAGNNPPRGVVVTYYFKQQPAGPVTLTFLDSKGQTIQRYSSAGRGRGAAVGTSAGTNRFVWNMNYPNAQEIPQGQFQPLEWAHARAPVAVPGSYKVQLTVDGQTDDQPFEIDKDPRVTASQADLEAQFALMMKIRDEITEVTHTVDRIHQLQAQVDEAAKRGTAGGSAAADAARIDATLKSIEGVLTRQTNPANPMFLPPKTVNIRLAGLTSVVESADATPTQQSYDVFNALSGQVEQQQARLKAVAEQQIPAFLKAANASGGGTPSPGH